MLAIKRLDVSKGQYEKYFKGCASGLAIGLMLWWVPAPFAIVGFAELHSVTSSMFKAVFSFFYLNVSRMAVRHH